MLLQAKNYEKELFAEEIVMQFNAEIAPILEYLKRRLYNSNEYEVVVDLEKLLKKIFSPVLESIEKRYPMLTNRETQIVSLILLGKSSKEIATILGVSKKTVEFHRYNIRKKLRLTNVSVFLRDHLIKDARY